MRPWPMLIAIFAATLPGCAGDKTGPWDPGIQDAYYDDDPVPFVTNDGFYDGGVFDQDDVDLEPGLPQ